MQNNFPLSTFNASLVSLPERATQTRIIQLFREELHYRYLGNWTDRNNTNIEETILTPWLIARGYSPAHINAALFKLRAEANNTHRTLYANNHEVYKLLRYGVPVKTAAGQLTETVPLVDWEHPLENDFAVAEEVTLKGNAERRPDLVLYVNGIALAVLELKRSSVSLGDGINQSLSNLQADFNAWFFTTNQLILAGNNSEGLRYGTLTTETKHFLKWKEDEDDNTRYKLDKYLLKLCEKTRLIELLKDFILFDGKKKLPRPHQYFGLKAAQEHVRARKGGIIWHTQGSGKSIIMVLLAKWILENSPHARVVIITDRDELDKQIEGVFAEAGEKGIKRTRSGRELMHLLGQPTPRLLCSLVHKFGRQDVDDFDAFIHELESQPSPAVGEIFIFVDECHRTQSGKLHRTMKALLPDAVFLGFTGTPLLKKDRTTSLEIFGDYIHTYKFSEGVEDGVILDLLYEARDINQRLTSQASVDEWFELVSQDLNEWQKDELKKHWGTMQKVQSSEARMRRVLQDILRDFKKRRRLNDGTGNAILVASSIYEACKYYTLFQRTPFKGQCAVVTSYNPQARDITLEETGANTETDKQFIYTTYTDLLKDVQPQPGKSKTETYEDGAKARFIKEPARMKLLIVVDKLLTGFDAPPCTYLYIDKSMQDHGLFQAICRVNRLDGEDKDFGYIVDYKDLFKKVENAIAVYTSELDHTAPGPDPEVLLQDRLKKGKERLDAALEALALLCEPVEPPKEELQYLRYFVGNSEIPTDVQAHEPQRVAFYRAVVALVRAYANLADELAPAGYTPADITRLKQQLKDYLNLRDAIRNAAEETLDLKPYEADMRHLIDTYIEADEPRKISPFDNLGLMDLIVKTGIAQAIAERLANLKGNETAIAETIENNVRKIILDASLTDPAFYANMSTLLDEIITARKARALEYEEYLQKINAVITQTQSGKADTTPDALNTPGKRALYNNLKPPAPQIADEKALYLTASDPRVTDPTLALALQIDETVRRVHPADWRGYQAREQVIKRALYDLLHDIPEVERLFNIIYQQNEY